MHGGFHGSPLQAASFSDHEHILRLFLETGADINAQGDSQDNALYAALSEGHLEVARLLWEKGWRKSPRATCWPQFDIYIAQMSGQTLSFARRD